MLVIAAILLALVFALVVCSAGWGPNRRRPDPGHLQLVLPQALDRPVEVTVTTTGGIELAPTVVDQLVAWPPLAGGPRPFLLDPDGVLVARVGQTYLEVTAGHGGTYDVTGLPWRRHDGRPNMPRGRRDPGYAVDARVRLRQ